MNRYEVVNYFNFGEATFSAFNTISFPTPFVPFDEVNEETNTYYNITQNLYLYGLEEDTGGMKPYCEKLFMLIYARYYKHFVFAIDGEWSVDNREYESALHDFFLRFHNTFLYTYDKYSTLIKMYEESYNKLMDKIETINEGVNKFLDTPQEGGDWIDENHTSTANSVVNTSKSDGDTLVNRLEEIKAKLSNIWKNWIDEFEGLFIDERSV